MKRHLIFSTLSAVLSIILIWFIAIIGPKIESAIFPVVINVQAHKFEVIDKSHTQILGSAEKHRACTFLKLEWYYGQPDAAHVLVPVKFLEGNKIREGGLFDFGPWEISLGVDQIKNQTFTIAYHRCRPFWLSETKFFP